MDEVYVDDEIVLVDEEGVEHTVNILFTYDNEDRGAQYVLFYDKNNPEEIIVARYYEDEENPDNLIYDLDLSDEELDEAEVILATYQEDPSIQDLIDEE